MGDEAPDFTLPSHNEGDLNLAWYRGRKNVALAFYPADWTPLCANQIPGYEAVLDMFEKYNCQILAVSCDTIPSHIAWAKSMGGISFPLMSDFYPHGAVSTRYGVLSRKGYANRVVFLIDKQGIIRYIEHVPPGDLPDNHKLFAELARLQKASA